MHSRSVEVADPINRHQAKAARQLGNVRAVEEQQAQSQQSHETKQPIQADTQYAVIQQHIDGDFQPEVLEWQIPAQVAWSGAVLDTTMQMDQQPLLAPGSMSEQQQQPPQQRQPGALFADMSLPQGSASFGFMMAGDFFEDAFGQQDLTDMGHGDGFGLLILGHSAALFTG